jgi:hypothetical protein
MRWDGRRRSAEYRIYDEADYPDGPTAEDLLEGDSCEAAALSEQVDLPDLSVLRELSGSPAAGPRLLLPRSQPHSLRRALAVTALGGVLGLMVTVGVRSISGRAPASRPALAGSPGVGHPPRLTPSPHPVQRVTRARGSRPARRSGRSRSRGRTARRLADLARMSQLLPTSQSAPPARGPSGEFGFEG